MDGRRPIAVITGGARRVGRAVADALADRCDLVLTYGRSQAEAQLAADELAARGRSIRLEQVDLGEPEQVESLGASLASSLPRVDVLVHNAAIYFPTPLATTNPEDATRLYRVNALAPLLLSKHLAPALSASDLKHGGSIVAFSDVHSLGRPRAEGFAAYAMTKAAITELVRCLAIELAPNIRVNAVAPGVVAFPESGYESDEASQRSYLQRVPLRRAGTPRDAGEAVRWLAFDAGYCTGQVIRVDGGRWLA